MTTVSNHTDLTTAMVLAFIAEQTDPVTVSDVTQALIEGERSYTSRDVEYRYVAKLVDALVDEESIVKVDGPGRSQHYAVPSDDVDTATDDEILEVLNQSADDVKALEAAQQAKAETAGKSTRKEAPDTRPTCAGSNMLISENPEKDFGPDFANEYFACPHCPSVRKAYVAPTNARTKIPGALYYSQHTHKEWGQEPKVPYWALDATGEKWIRIDPNPERKRREGAEVVWMADRPAVSTLNKTAIARELELRGVEVNGDSKKAELAELLEAARG